MENSKLYIHFDLEGGKHIIPIHQSIITEQSIERIINNLSENIFEGKIKYEIFVEPDIEGGLVKNIIISAFVGLASYTFTSASDGFLKGLTGKNIAEYSQNFGIAMKEATIGFLTKNSQDLIEEGFCVDKFYNSYDAKNFFYKTAIANDDVKGIGFCKEHDFPIEKGYFLYKTIELKKEKSGNKFIDKYHDLLVVSPINSELDKHLKWQVKDKVGDERFSVSLGDEDFYKIYFTNNLLIREFKVRVRYYISVDNFGEEKIESKEIIMVYEYNNTYKLMTLPSDFQIESAPYKLPDNYNEITNQTNLTI